MMFFFFVALCGGASSAEAIESGGSCGIYVISNTNVPEVYREKMKAESDESASICIDEHKKIVKYESVSPIAHAHFGVCVFDIRPLSTQGFSRARHRMFRADGTCPLQDDAHYISVSGVSEGLFVVLTEFAEKLSSAAYFDSNWAIDVSDKNIHQGELSQLRKGLFAKDSDAKLRLEAISLVEPMQGSFFGYEFVFQSKNPSSRWVVAVDFTPQGLKVFDFQPIY